MVAKPRGPVELLHRRPGWPRERLTNSSAKHVADRFAYPDAELHKQMQGLGLWPDTSGMSVAETVEVIIRCADEATLLIQRTGEYDE